MENFEKNIQSAVSTEPEQSDAAEASANSAEHAEAAVCKTAQATTLDETNAENAAFSPEAPPAANAGGEPRTTQDAAARTPVYNANIPGPTKYDYAHRTYRDALNRGQQTGRPNGERQGFAIASISLGVFSVLMLVIPVLGWIIGLGTSVTGIVLGAFGLKGKLRGLSIAGLTVSIVALALIILLIVLFSTFIFAAIQEGISTYAHPYRFTPRGFSGSMEEFFPYIR